MFRKKNGDTLWGMMSASVMDVDGQRCLLSVTRDLSEAKTAEDEIKRLAYYDPLTGLPNRRMLLERLRQALTQGGRSTRKRALLFVDLDNFKTLNDTLGHHVGDMLLQEVAHRITSCIRETDMAARIGGDEFVVIVGNLSEDPEEAATQAGLVGEKIQARISEPYTLAQRECINTSSVGITVFGYGSESASQILQQADIAMYQAKAAGRNAIRFFVPSLQAAVNARACLEEEIRAGIRDRQFCLWYQPQVNGSRIVGAEALLRWNHPRRGVLGPGEFISVAEESGLIVQLGRMVIEDACRQAAAWAGAAAGPAIPIAVNVSARQFRQPDFVSHILNTLARTGAPPVSLKLEITESMLVDSIEDTVSIMKTLKTHGLQFSLDDFGTGYSSLAYLKRLPLDQLKIDRSFVRDILVNATNSSLAQAIISLARALGLLVIAEGVETHEQRDLLSRLGCDCYQGFLFSKAVTATDFEKLLAARPTPSLRPSPAAVPLFPVLPSRFSLVFTAFQRYLEIWGAPFSLCANIRIGSSAATGHLPRPHLSPEECTHMSSPRMSSNPAVADCSAFSRRSFFRFAAGASALATVPILTEAHLAHADRPEFADPNKGIHIDANENPMGPSDAARKAMSTSFPAAAATSSPAKREPVEIFAKQEGLDRRLRRAASPDRASRSITPSSHSPARIARSSIADPGYEAPMWAAQVSGAPILKVPLCRSQRRSAPRHQRPCSPPPPTPASSTSATPTTPPAPARPARHRVRRCQRAQGHSHPHRRGLYPPLRRAPLARLRAEGKNVVVLRTFSKLYGMAGIRMGFAVGRPDLLKKISWLRRR